MAKEFVSLLMLTHNAPDFVRTSIESVKSNTEGVDYELIVLDNASESETVELVKTYRDQGLVDVLVLSETNTLFAKGNNLAAKAASPRASHFLLINSDIEIKSKSWLRDLLDVHKPGITTYGMVDKPLRGDGYCLLIDAHLYSALGLNETYQWWWGITWLQAEVMKMGYSVQGYWEHEAKIHHFGGKSGDAFKGSKGMETTSADAEAWFEGKKPVILDRQAYMMEKAKRTLRRWRRKLVGRR